MARDWWLITGDAYALRYPETCACCQATTSERWNVVPYCRACRAHVPRFGPWAIAIATVIVGGAAVVVLRKFAAFAPWPVHLAVTIVAAFALPAIATWQSRRRRVGPPHVDHEQAAEITRDGLLVRSETWAEQVAQLNGAEATSTPESSLAVLDRVLPWLVVALPIAFVITWYPTWHATLWIDNGTHDRVTVRGNDHELATVAAGTHVEVSIPRGAIHLSTSAGDHVDIDPGVETGSWVLNVGRAHCYEWQTFGYAKNEHALYFGGEAKRYDERLFHVTANWFFRPPPETIEVRKERAIGSLPEERAALQIVRCER